MKPATRDKALPADAGHPPIVLRLRPILGLSGDQLLELSGLNRDLRLELTAKGELVIMPPTGFETGSQNVELTMQIGMWAKSDGSGVAADSSTGFILPNGAIRSPDAAWIATSRLETLSVEQRKKFLPLCPDSTLR